MPLPAYYLSAFVVGLVAASYLSLNGRLSEQIGSSLLATAIFFAVGALAATIAWVVAGSRAAVGELVNVNPALFLLGIVSFGIILCATFFIPRIGPGAYFVCLVLGQTVAGLALSHFGWLAAERLPMTPLKVVGALAVIGGVMMIYVAESQQH